ncbi:hypothetical protein PXJ20_10580 [Paraburkholderia sp. A1RI_3L]|uniref:hypothetical protein n=1 Tax=Paraburkholderia TaxID=1822464 RepID=UPI003B79939D
MSDRNTGLRGIKCRFPPSVSMDLLKGPLCEAAVAGISIANECRCAWNGRFPFADLSASIKNQSALLMRHGLLPRALPLERPMSG